MPAGYNNVACITAEATTVGYNPNVFDLWRRSAGRVDLSEGAFRRRDEAPDEEFYRVPRFVTHIDDGAISAVTQLYREYFPAGGAILDLMSSWISHLPPEVSYRRVAGLGMNEAELAANPRLDERVVQNLNTDPRLPFAAGEFDGVAICVSIDYLTDAVTVLREAGRVSTVGAPTVISFSKKCAPPTPHPRLPNIMQRSLRVVHTGSDLSWSSIRSRRPLRLDRIDSAGYEPPDLSLLSRSAINLIS